MKASRLNPDKSAPRCGNSRGHDARRLVLPRPKRTCTADDCERPAFGQGWCSAHYYQWRRHGKVGPIKVRIYGRVCSVEGCAEPGGAESGYCRVHYKRWWRHGDPLRVNNRWTVDIGARSQPGTRYRDSQSGYVSVYLPDHPNAGATGRVKEHILVMATHLGRALRPSESVHHRNGIRDDNQLSNLELWASPHPSGQRVTDLVAFAREILATYAAEVDDGLLGTAA